MAIIEQGNTFGGGALQNYMINSNTSADSFIGHLNQKCFEKLRN